MRCVLWASGHSDATLSRMKTRAPLALLAAASLLALAGCATPRDQAEALTLETNPLRKARVGDDCRYRAVRDGEPGKEAVAESWTIRVLGSKEGQARLEVQVLGPERIPASPSPREPGYSFKFPTADSSLSSTEILRLFHRPDLTTPGMLTVLGRDFTRLEGSTRSFTLVSLGRTRLAREMTVSFSDKQLVRGTYRVVMVDELPVLGIAEAELTEEWESVQPDGSINVEKRHETLTLVDAHEATAK